MSSYYYKCEFEGWTSDTSIVIKTERKLKDLDALHILHKYYKANMAIYEANNIHLPQIGDLDSITRTMHVDFERAIIICDGNTATDCNIIVCPPTNKHPTGLILESSANIPPNCAAALLKEIAEEWAYRNKLVRCVWADFLDNVTDDFLAEHGITRRTDILPQKRRPLYLEPANHVLTQSVTIVLRDQNQELTDAYQVEMPNHITTAQEMLAHFTRIAKAMAHDIGAIFVETKLSDLLREITNDKTLYERFRTRVRPVETEAVVTFRNDRLLAND